MELWVTPQMPLPGNPRPAHTVRCWTRLLQSMVSLPASTWTSYSRTTSQINYLPSSPSP